MAKNYYDILGVSRDATSEEIKKAFRLIARSTHPDANPGDPVSEARFAMPPRLTKSCPTRTGDVDTTEGTQSISPTCSPALAGSTTSCDRCSATTRCLVVPPRARPTRKRRLGAGRGRPARCRLRHRRRSHFRNQEHMRGVLRNRGEEGHGQTTCPQCGGAGSIRVARRSLFGTMMTVGTCPSCSGEGVLSPARVRRVPARAQWTGSAR